LERHVNFGNYLKSVFMNLNTKYEDLSGGEENKGKKAGVESTFSKDANANVGTGPSPNIADGGTEGEEKQPKENTGNLTEMGGATGGKPGLNDASEGNDNTGGHE
jgi:hypothetical protein